MDYLRDLADNIISYAQVYRLRTAALLLLLAVAAVITDGVPRFVGKGRNTPAPNRRVRVAQSKIVQDFAPGAH